MPPSSSYYQSPNANRHGGYHDGYGHHRHHRHHRHGVSFHLGVFYPFHCGIRVRYPYVGYYHYYDYPYLSLYGCDFYSGFYVRFGHARISYYASCPLFGVHSHPGHHFHSYSCSLHGIHHYHVRDCTQCYPSGSTTYIDAYVDSHVDAASLPSPDAIPDAAVESGPSPEENDAPEVTADDEVVPLFRDLDAKPAGRRATPTEAADAYFAALTPAKLTFVLGFLAFEQGDYEEASEHFFNASIEDGASVVPKLFLSMSLISIAEYGYAASYLRMALERSPDLIDHSFDVRKVYGQDHEAEFDAHRERLTERSDVFSADPDTQLLNSFVALNVGDFERAASSAMTLRDTAESTADSELGRRLLEAVTTRRERRPDAADAAASALEAFLADPDLARIKDLPID